MISRRHGGHGGRSGEVPIPTVIRDRHHSVSCPHASSWYFHFTSLGACSGWPWPALGRQDVPSDMGIGERRCLVPPPRWSPYYLLLVPLNSCSNTWPVRNARWQQEHMPHPPLIPGNSHAVGNTLKCGSFKNWTDQRMASVSTVQVRFWDFRVVFIMCISTYINTYVLFYDP